MVEENRDRRWQDFHAHEFYCAGHMFQAAVAHHRATGQRRFLDAASRFADYLCEQFGPSGRPWYPGHPEVELALVELYRETQRRRYLDLAACLLERNRDVDPAELRGHAVRALYYACAMTDCYAETGQKHLRDVLENHWRTMTCGKMYITGGVGSRPRGESFGEMFELPNLNAYAETCAAAANVFWNWRLLTLEGEAQFADVLERTLYNGSLAGVSLDGVSFFYVNPLACTGQGRPDPWYDWARGGPLQRREFYHTTCCPPNALRLLAALPGHFYSTSRRGVWVHLYGSSTIDWRLPDGARFALEQATDYPWSGEIKVHIRRAEGPFSIFLRIPGWCSAASLNINGQPSGPEPVPGTYLELERDWQVGDLVQIQLDMGPQLMESDPRVPGNRGSLAIQRGPLVYCVESPDNPEVDLFEARIDPAQVPHCKRRPDLLGGVIAIEVAGRVPLRESERAPLYRAIGSRPDPPMRPVTLTAIPYYAWANRGPAQMTVWMRHADRP
jgi:DUF1680 family protein